MLGIDPTKLGGRRQLTKSQCEDVPIWPDMVDGWGLFLAMGTQWTLVGTPGGLFQSGLKYESLPVVAAGIGLAWPLPPSVFLDLRTLEGEALRYWSAKRR